MKFTAGPVSSAFRVHSPTVSLEESRSTNSTMRGLKRSLLSDKRCSISEFNQRLSELCRLAIFLLLLAPVLCTPLQAQSPAPAPTFRDAIIDKLLDFKKRNRLTSLSFAMFQGDAGISDFAAGYANSSRKIKATPDHIYTIASVTKAITAMTLVDLVHQNYLSLSDSVHSIIPGFPANVTVQDLLNHTSGFHREKENEKFLKNSNYTDVLSHLPIKFRLKIHRYANFNYAAAGAVIEKVMNRKFSDVAGEYYKSVAGEDLYYANRKDIARDSRFVRNYVRRGRRLYGHDLIDFGLWEPAAFAQTTARGLAKFLRSHMTPQLIDFIESHAVTIKRRKTRDGVSVRDSYALGWRLRYVGDELHYIYHNGFLYGVLSTLYYFPKKDFGFAALSNMSYYPRQRVAIGSLYRSIETIVDDEFSERIARYTAENGYVAGVVFFETNNRYGELNQGQLDEFAKGLMRDGRYREAVHVYKLANHVFPRSQEIYEALANAHKKNGNPKLAAEILMKGKQHTSAESLVIPMLSTFGAQQ